MTDEATLIPELYGGEIEDEYIVCRDDGTIISTGGIKSLKAATKLMSASFFRFIGSSDAARLAMMLDEMKGGEKPQLAGFDVRMMSGYNYALVEIRSDFGVQYMIVRLYKTKKDYFASDFVKNGRIASVLDSFSSDAKKLSAKLTMGDASAAASMVADSAAITSMLSSIAGKQEKPRTFDVAEANGRIAQFYASQTASSSTDCVLTHDRSTLASPDDRFITKRDVDSYVRMIVSLISAMSLVSSSRKIVMKSECFGDCARVTVSTEAADRRLLSLSSCDLSLVSSSVPRIQTRLTEAEYFASLLDVRLRAVGSLSGGTFSFSLTLTNKEELPVEFKHPDPLSDIGSIISAACAMFPMSPISEQAGL